MCLQRHIPQSGSSGAYVSWQMGIVTQGHIPLDKCTPRVSLENSSDVPDLLFSRSFNIVWQIFRSDRLFFYFPRSFKILTDENFLKTLARSLKDRPDYFKRPCELGGGFPWWSTQRPSFGYRMIAAFVRKYALRVDLNFVLCLPLPTVSLVTPLRFISIVCLNMIPW